MWHQNCKKNNNKPQSNKNTQLVYYFPGPHLEICCLVNNVKQSVSSEKNVSPLISTDGGTVHKINQGKVSQHEGSYLSASRAQGEDLRRRCCLHLMPRRTAWAFCSWFLLISIRKRNRPLQERNAISAGGLGEAEQGLTGSLCWVNLARIRWFLGITPPPPTYSTDKHIFTVPGGG